MTNQWITEVEKLRAELAAYKAKNYDPAESIRLNAEVMEWKSLCFAQGMKLKALEVENKELLEAGKRALAWLTYPSAITEATTQKIRTQVRAAIARGDR